MSKPLRNKYSKEFKREAIGLVVDQGYSKAEAGRSLGIHPDLIRRWQREFEVGGHHAFPGQGKLAPDQLLGLGTEKHQVIHEWEPVTQ